MTSVSRILLLLSSAILITPASAAAQIFAWRDANGTLVLTDRSVDAPTAVYAVHGAPAYRTTRQSLPTNAEMFEPLVTENALRHSLRPELVRAVIQVESGFDPRATSPKGAMGLMQLMPQTARELGVVDAYDPAQNIRGGTAYLRQLLDRYGDEQLALAAYNAGSGTVDKYGRTIPPYRETRNYVRKVGEKAGASPGVRRRPVIYKTIEIIDGRVVPKFSQNPPPAGITYEMILL